MRNQRKKNVACVKVLVRNLLLELSWLGTLRWLRFKLGKIIVLKQ